MPRVPSLRPPPPRTKARRSRGTRRVEGQTPPSRPGAIRTPGSAQRGRARGFPAPSGPSRGVQRSRSLAGQGSRRRGGHGEGGAGPASPGAAAAARGATGLRFGQTGAPPPSCTGPRGKGSAHPPPAAEPPWARPGERGRASGWAGARLEGRARIGQGSCPSRGTARGWAGAAHRSPRSRKRLCAPRSGGACECCVGTGTELLFRSADGSRRFVPPVCYRGREVSDRLRGDWPAAGFKPRQAFGLRRGQIGASRRSLGP